MNAGENEEQRFAGFADQIARLHAEADRRLADVGRRSDAIASRAAITLGAAAIATGVHIIGPVSALGSAAGVFGLASAALAIPTLLFRRSEEVNLRAFETDLRSWTPHRMDWEILLVKTSAIESDENRIRWRARVLLYSYLAFGIAIACSALELIREFMERG